VWNPKSRSSSSNMLSLAVWFRAGDDTITEATGTGPEKAGRGGRPVTRGWVGAGRPREAAVVGAGAAVTAVATTAAALGAAVGGAAREGATADADAGVLLGANAA
jgi:hypothetical protein